MPFSGSVLLVIQHHDPLLCRKALLLPAFTSLTFEEIAGE